MSYVLLLVIFYGNNPATSQTIEFRNNEACLRALNNSLELENINVKIKARCFKVD